MMRQIDFLSLFLMFHSTASMKLCNLTGARENYGEFNKCRFCICFVLLRWKGSWLYARQSQIPWIHVLIFKIILHAEFRRGPTPEIGPLLQEIWPQPIGGSNDSRLFIIDCFNLGCIWTVLIQRHKKDCLLGMHGSIWRKVFLGR